MDVPALRLDPRADRLPRPRERHAPLAQRDRVPRALLIALLAACGGTQQRIIADDKRCTEDKLTRFSMQLGVARPTFDVEAPAGSESGRRYVELVVTRERDRIREVAERENMDIEVSGVDNGVLVRATCR